MDKEEQFALAVRQVFDKQAWLNKEKMEKKLRDYTPSEVHCIEAINKTAEPNVTKLAETLYMTRGAISKLTKKLIQKGLIASYRKPENKKEIYFRLTAKGSAVNKIHDELHAEFWQRDKAIFDQLTPEQLAAMSAFVQAYSEHLDTEIKQQGLKIR